MRECPYSAEERRKKAINCIDCVDCIPEDDGEEDNLQECLFSINNFLVGGLSHDERRKSHKEVCFDKTQREIYTR